MEKCLIDAKSIYAIDYKLDYTKENEIRLLGANNKLFCPECLKPVIYKRGEIVDAHFAHKEISNNCDYNIFSQYSRNRTPISKIIKELLYNHLCKNYPDYSIEKDDKLIKGHWTDLTVNVQNKIIAIEIDDKIMTAKKLNKLRDSYRLNNINVNWIVIDKIKDLLTESQAYYIKRSILNESSNNSVLVVDRDDLKFIVYRLDTKKYLYKNTYVEHKFKENVFSYKFNLSDLYIDENGIYIKGFNEEFYRWLRERENDFLLKQYEIFENIFNWNEEKYLEIVNRIALGEHHLIDMLVLRLNKIKLTKEFDEFIIIYNNIKNISILNNEYQYIVDIYDNILNKLNEIEL